MLRFVAGRLRRLDLATRLPFRYGIVTVLGLPHVFLEAWVEIDGRPARGVAAEHLAPKWFEKDPATTPQEDVDSLLDAVRDALALAEGRAAPDAFTLWRSLYDDLAPPTLRSHFGVTLVERAAIYALCRDAGRPFHALLADGSLGIRPNLPPPLPRVVARHTVGLLDPLEDDDVAGDAPDDGLPRSLAACVRAHGLRHFKVKIGGDPDADAARVEAVLATLERHAAGDWRFTLDGNESYPDIAPLRVFWERLSRHRDAARLLFVEQPLHRDAALAPSVGDALRAWPDRPPLIVDESDATLDAVPTALSLGYAGTSHKNCKGVFKGVLNAARVRAAGGILSGEDLSTVGPVALPSDLAVQAALGIESVERNGHHYFAGLSGFPEALREAALASDRHLYARAPAGWPAVRVADGTIDLAGVNAAPFGVAFDPDLSEIPEIG